MTDEELLRNALARVAAQADGNGVSADDVSYAGGSVDWHEFEHLVRCDVEVARSDESFAGDAPDDGLEFHADESDVDDAVRAYAAALRSSPKLVPIALDALRSREDHGFDTTRTPLSVDSTVRRFAWRRTCDRCRGNGRVTCPGCAGRCMVSCNRCVGGKVSCIPCNGTGGRTSFDSVKQAQTRKICLICTGTGRVSCGSCGGSGRVRCPRCGGTGDAECPGCKGHGYHTDVATVGGVGNLRPEARWGATPAAARRVLSAFGVPKLIYGHAEIRANGDEAIDPTSARLRFGVRVPVGSLTARVGAGEFSFDVVGLKSHPLARGPFIERLSESGIRQLEHAAAGPIGPAEKRLMKAAEFDMVRCAAHSCLERGWEADQGFVASYPSVPLLTAAKWIDHAREAVGKALRGRARRRRRRWYLLALFVLLAWFVLGARQEVVPNRNSFSVFDLLLPAVLVGLGWLWIRFRLHRDTRRLWYRLRPDPEMEWRRYRRRFLAMDPPGVGVGWLILAVALMLPPVVEAGWGLRGTHAKEWAQVRKPWAPALDPLWSRARFAMDESLRPKRTSRE